MDPPSRTPLDRADVHKVVAGRYRLERSFGTSNMAEVFVATDLQLRRQVAVKRLPGAAMGDATAKARFAREARALARVNDPHVITVYDIVIDDGRPFLVMEFVDGVTLRDLVRTNGRLDPAHAVSIASGICIGLAAVHARGIVHRDMKPSNVFLTRSGAVKIGDFGIASVTSDVTLTRTGEVFGSAPYVSPEQVTGERVDGRADLYALGCIMYEMVTGRPPFLGGDPATLAYQHVHAIAERADQVDPQVPAALASTIERLMAKDPADRPGTADAVRRSLELMSSNVPSADVPTQPIERVATTDVLPTAQPIPLSEPPRSPSRLPWVAGLVAGMIALLLVSAYFRGAAPAVPVRTSRSHQPASQRSVTPSPRSPSPSTSPPSGSIDGAATALTGLVGELVSSGSVDEHLARDLQHSMDEVVRALSRSDAEKAMDALGHLHDSVERGIDHGEISSEDAGRLDEAIQVLATALGSGEQDAGD
jgi:eukaryotic-like serine/threonine-protein kinase